MTMEDYRYAGSKHTSKDKEVDLDFVKKNNKILNGHCSMLLKIFLVGSKWAHEGRMRESYLTNSLNVCPFYLPFKDHKGWEGHMEGPPPTRGIASAAMAQNSPISEIIYMVVEPLVSGAKFGFEKISGTDFLSQVDQMNDSRIKQNEQQKFDQLNKDQGSVNITNTESVNFKKVDSDEDNIQPTVENI